MTNSVLPVESIETESPEVVEDVRQLQLQLMLLKRLARLTETRAKVDPSVYPTGRRMIDQALYSTYWDCVKLGRRDDARMILRLDQAEPTGESLAA